MKKAKAVKEVNEPSSEVASAFDAFPAQPKLKLLQLRKLIYSTAAGNSSIGPLIETLKWGQPAYLPKKPRVGTTIRLGYSDKTPSKIHMFVHCQTTLVDTYRTLLGSEPDELLSFEGNRAIAIARKPALPKAPLALCIEAALTYHLNKHPFKK